MFARLAQRDSGPLSLESAALCKDAFVMNWFHCAKSRTDTLFHLSFMNVCRSPALVRTARGSLRLLRRTRQAVVTANGNMFPLATCALFTFYSFEPQSPANPSCSLINQASCPCLLSFTYLSRSRSYVFGERYSAHASLKRWILWQRPLNNREDTCSRLSCMLDKRVCLGLLTSRECGGGRIQLSTDRSRCELFLKGLLSLVSNVRKHRLSAWVHGMGVVSED